MTHYSKIFGTHSENELKRIYPIAEGWHWMQKAFG